MTPLAKTLTRVALASSALVLLLPAAIFVRTFWREYASFRAPPTPVDRGPALRALPSLVDVSWQSQGNAVRGWFLPGRERAAVVLLHGGMGARSGVLPELEILARRGLCLLAFDWPGQGESGGYGEGGEAERAALRSAIDWLGTRTEVDPARIGAFGFSSGGVPLIQVAATDSRIRAVAVAGTPGNVEQFARWEYRKHGLLSQWPALLAMRLRGIRVEEQIPDEVVGRIAPRPLLVVLGTADDIVPPPLTRAIFEAARAPKEILEVPNAAHGAYAREAPTVYGDSLTSFFVRNLLD